METQDEFCNQFQCFQDLAGNFNKILSKYDAVIFFKFGCPHSSDALALLESKVKSILRIEISQFQSSALRFVQEFTQSKHKFTTVPQIFLRRRFVGGHADLVNLNF